MPGKLVFLFIAAALTSHSDATAQVIGAEAVQLSSTEGDIHSPTGIRMRLATGIVFLSIETVHDSQRRNAIFCTGLVPPDRDCGPKPSRISTNLITVLLGAAQQSKSFGGHIGAGFGLFAATWSSLVTTDRLHENQFYVAVEGGADYRRPIGSGRFVLKIGATSRVLIGRPSNCEDCSTLYDEGFLLGGATLGFEYRL